jgi:hypothetical protein
MVDWPIRLRDTPVGMAHHIVELKEKVALIEQMVAPLYYHPNMQCSCEGCRLARATIAPSGGPYLPKHTGMTSCWDEKCTMCTLLQNRSKFPQRRTGLERALKLIEYFRGTATVQGAILPEVEATLDNLKGSIKAELENDGPLTSVIG